MSGLIGLALLACATGALRERLSPRVRVLMHPDDPVEPTGPLIAIYVERANSKPGGAGFALHGSAQTQLRFELFAPVSTSAGLRGSGALFLLWRQIVGALAPGAGEWAALWERLALSITSVEFAQELFESESGARIAAHVHEVSIEALAEPQFGEPSTFFVDLLAHMRASSADFSSIADQFETALTGDLAGLEALAASLSLSPDSMAAIGLGAQAQDASIALGDGDFDDGETIEISEAVAENGA